MSPSLENPPSLSAEELHQICFSAHRLGNRARRRYIHALYALHVTGLYSKLGFSSAFHYAESEYGYCQSQTYEDLRAAEALEKLPLTAQTFEAGKLCYSALLEIKKIAKPETEAEWLALARKKSVRALKAEVEDALRNGRDRPRRGRGGLPRVKIHVHLTLSPEEHELLEKAIKKVRDELKEPLGGKHLEPKEALLFMAGRMLETDPAGTPRGREERKDSPYTILYRVCIFCKASQVWTSEGPVDVPRDAVERVEAGAQKVEITAEEETARAKGSVEESTKAGPQRIDKPNSQRLVRRVLLNGGLRCANPFCRRVFDLQGDHIQGRAEGGRTSLSNEEALCPVCHSLKTQGYISVEGNPVDGLTFRPRVKEIPLEEDGDREELRKLPVVVSSESFSRRLESPFLFLAGGLENIGYSRKEAQERIQRAVEELTKPGEVPTEEEVLKAALG
jgi:hypothetical protein